MSCTHTLEKSGGTALSEISDAEIIKIIAVSVYKCSILDFLQGISRVGSGVGCGPVIGGLLYKVCNQDQLVLHD